MKLIFSKDDENNLSIQMATGTVVEEFSYVEMIKNLIKNNKFDDTQYDEKISIAEREKIESMLKEINESIEQENNEE